MVTDKKEVKKEPEEPVTKKPPETKKPQDEVDTPEAYCCNLDCGSSCVLVHEDN